MERGSEACPGTSLEERRPVTCPGVDARGVDSLLLSIQQRRGQVSRCKGSVEAYPSANVDERRAEAFPGDDVAGIDSRVVRKKNFDFYRVSTLLVGCVQSENERFFSLI